MSLDDVYAAAVATVRTRVVRFVTELFGPDAISDAGAEAFAARALPAVVAGQRQTAALTDAYLTRVLATEFDERIATGRTIDTRQGLRGVDPSIVYRRPVKTVRYALSQGKDVSEAVAQGVQRLTKITQSDMQLAKTRQAHKTLGRSTVDGYERVLKGDYDCAKCIVASTRFYHKAQLMPMHPGCDCDVKPIRKPKGRNIILHSERLDDLADLITASGLPTNASAQDYQNLIVVHEHGELGPVLALRDEHFRRMSDLPDNYDRLPRFNAGELSGEPVVRVTRRPRPAPPREPAAAPAPPKADRSAVAKRLLPGLESSLANLRAKGLPEDAPQIQYHLKQIARLRAALAN